jgi:dTDP-4-dehydrorhamnose reductase
MAKPKILITGSNGLLGQKLINQLSQQSHYDFVETSRGENRVKQITDFDYRPLDVTNEGQVLQVIAEEKPDFIIHTAAMTNVDQCEDEPEDCTNLNVNAVHYLVKAATQIQAFFLHLSTDFIFDGESGPYQEDDAPAPLSLYGKSKLEAENSVTASSIPWAIARTVLEYGITEDMSRSNIILWAKGKLETGQELQMVTDQWRTPTLAEDLAKGCLLIIKHKAQGIYHISGDEMLTPYDMVMQTATYFNLDKSLVHKADASKFTQRAKRPPKTGFILDKAKKDLGYSPHSFMDGIQIVSDQMKEAEKLKL